LSASSTSLDSSGTTAPDIQPWTVDGFSPTGADKYGLDQGDFYQLHAYGQSYLDGEGDVVLIYPRTDAFHQALPVFDFPKSKGLRLWVLPFCLEERVLVLPQCGSLDIWFSGEQAELSQANTCGLSS
jgi:5-methylcytosine-specific restriction enzyme subunit McrC